MNPHRIAQWITVFTLVVGCQYHVIYAQAPVPPTAVEAIDTPNDNGASVTVTWEKSVDDGGGAQTVTGYKILRSVPDDEFEEIAQLPVGTTRYVDRGAKDGPAFAYVVQAFTADGAQADSPPTEPVKAVGNWYHTKKTTLLIAFLFFSAVTLVFIQMSRSGRELFIRKIAGLDAVEEAVGRATEMGRPIFFIPGLNSISDPATIAAVNIFESVARYAAEDQTKLKAPCYNPIVMNIMQNSLKEVYQTVGRPDMFQSDDVFFVNDQQFAYVAAVDGMIIREKPAAVFLQGYFYAESLILAEVSNTIGAIQIAGTSSDAQLPFFIAACDYTLIGEELYAAGAYMRRDALQLSTLKAQDLVKLLLFVLLLFGSILLLFDVDWILSLFEKKW